MSVWSVKTRHAPSRKCRDARVYGHTTTAMHDNEYTLPPPGLGFDKLGSELRPRVCYVKTCVCYTDSCSSMQVGYSCHARWCVWDYR